MSLLLKLPDIMREARAEYEELAVSGDELRFVKVLSASGAGGSDENIFLHGDNIDVLSHGVRTGRLRGKVDMIYCDPPFFSGANPEARVEISSERYPEIGHVSQRAYRDAWGCKPEDYFKMLAVRLLLMKDILSERGSIFVHLDWHAVHAVKLVMDDIFGQQNFINEIIWNYKSGGTTKRGFSRKHDNILFYGKNKNYKFFAGKEKSYNRELRPYHFKGVKEYRDETGWYTMVNRKDVWNIDMVGRNAGERVNYATQKPEALISRMVEAVTEEGDVCADFFCGSGTLAVCAAAADRRFICVDSASLAISNSLKRPLKTGIGFALYEVRKSGAADAAHVLNGRSAHIMPRAAHNYGRSGGLAGNEGFNARLKYADGKYHIGFESCSIPLDTLRCGDEKKDMLRRLMREEPEVFVDYWCTGTMGEADCFAVQKAFFREKKGKNTGAPGYVWKEAPHGGSEKEDIGVCGCDCDEKGPTDVFAIFVFDIFGRRYICRLCT